MSKKEPFLNNQAQIESISNELTQQIDTLLEHNQNLKEFEGLLGSKEDTRSMRKEMKQEIGDANNLIKKTLANFRSLDQLNLRKREEAEFRNKVARRAREAFDKEQQKFTKIVKDIQTKEKVYIDTKKSIAGNKDSFASDGGAQE
mmetsp:Transcript_34926/g.31458  ORF Transcript_34926/g.31458 Transcript_34926/m.31458 type:complete len:145 (+) Transcript_34926:47-481(+)|eukprot:CAMPEP_0114582480 /NCGR_PEP_ID=MMETSP0125-20121206/6449_1 /TAXON_ID=485358 ORGANISM="Aristerostoma sp., Strain ATCC 50986" /NCGR_SAMPLE_ID=MMETSP0125 /ASSEMBLY_ACC=CAM_ASM_000245 /LENGTH=144 /DNA_ID=CAMNT_0001775451 /DNA_START=47 /DNA_END=481 /DNA_ORIENTATION=-